jgi:hypothetical protein
MQLPWGAQVPASATTIIWESNPVLAMRVLLFALLPRFRICHTSIVTDIGDDLYVK